MCAAITGLKSPYDDLVVRAADGDRAAFRTLYDEFSGYAYAILRRLVGPSPHVDDLLQLVFVKVFRELPEFRGDKPFRAWLRRACFYVVYDHLRGAGRSAAISLDALEDPDEHLSDAQGEGPSRAEHGPERAFRQAEIRKRTRAVLEKLTPEKRMALILHDFEGYTLDEAAEVLGCSRFTVRTRLVRGRREFAALARKDKQLVQLAGGGDS